jgi:hypothetical protein
VLRGEWVFLRPEPADNQRIVGWRFMYQLIANDTWMISENCPEALNAVPAAQYDKDGSNIEDICKTDHLYDDVIDELSVRPAVDAEQQEQAI